jgi:hypothetical protein
MPDVFSLRRENPTEIPIKRAIENVMIIRFMFVLHLSPIVTCAPRRNGFLTGSTRKRS